MKIGRYQDGFTLIELMIGLAVAGLMLGGAVVTIRSVTKSELRSAANKIAGTMRYASNYSRASGKQVRLAFDFEKGVIWLEETEHQITLKEGREQRGMTKEEASGNEDIVLAEDDDGFGLSEADGNLEPVTDEILDPPPMKTSEFKPVRGVRSNQLKLPRSIRLGALQTARHKKVVGDGKGYIYFFPQGYTESSIVQVMNDDDDVYTISLHPFLGRAATYPCEIPLPMEFGSEGDVTSGLVSKDICRELDS